MAAQVFTVLGVSSVQAVKDTVRAEKTRVTKGDMTPVMAYQAPGAILSVKVLEQIEGAQPPLIRSGRAQLLAPDRAEILDPPADLPVEESVYPNGDPVDIRLWNRSRFAVPKGAILIAQRDNQGLWVCDYTPPEGHILVKNNSPDYIPEKAIVGIDLPILESPVYGANIEFTVEITQAANPSVPQNQVQRVTMSEVPAFGSFRLKMLNPATDEWCYSDYMRASLGTGIVGSAIDQLIECLYGQGAISSQAVIFGDIEDMTIEFNGTVTATLDVPLIHVESTLRSGKMNGTALRQVQEGLLIYSCMKNQARHGNRIGVLSRGLLPDEIGYAAVTALSYSFYLSQKKFDADRPQFDSHYPDDALRHLGIAAGAWTSDEPLPGTGTELDYTEGQDGWGIRRRPHWLLPIPRYGNDVALDTRELPYTGGRSATSRGRVAALAGNSIDDITCLATGTIACIGGRWRPASDSSCGDSCSLWPVIEDTDSAAALGLVRPCVEDSTVEDVRCVPAFPFKSSAADDEYVTGRNAITGYYSTTGVMEDSASALDYWLYGSVIMGTVAEDAKNAFAGDGSPDMVECRGLADMADGEEKAEKMRRCCAMVTCTYNCEHPVEEWGRARGLNYLLGSRDELRVKQQPSNVTAPLCNGNYTLTCTNTPAMDANNVVIEAYTWRLTAGCSSANSNYPSDSCVHCGHEPIPTGAPPSFGDDYRGPCLDTQVGQVQTNPCYEGYGPCTETVTVNYECHCPDFVIADRKDFEIPCTGESTPSEITLGMVRVTTDTTTTDTTTTSTTTSATSTATTTCLCDQNTCGGGFTVYGTGNTAWHSAWTCSDHNPPDSNNCHDRSDCVCPSPIGSYPFDQWVKFIAQQPPPNGCGIVYPGGPVADPGAWPAGCYEATTFVCSGEFGTASLAYACTCGEPPPPTSTSSNTTGTTSNTTSSSSTSSSTAATGACCVTTAFPHCEAITAAACAAWGPPGTYLGDGVSCSDPNPCAQSSSSSGTTSDTTSDTSTSTSTAADGACCYLMDGSPACLVTYPGPCASLPSGVFQGAGSTCFPDPC